MQLPKLWSFYVLVTFPVTIWSALSNFCWYKSPAN